MKWTDVRPSTPGWYWWYGKFNNQPQVVFVYHCNVGLCVDFGDGEARPLSGVGGQWSDAPIAEPEGD